MVNLNLTAALLAASGLTIQRFPIPDDPITRVLDLVDGTCADNNPVQIFSKGESVIAQNWFLVATGGFNQVQVESVACPGSFLSYAAALPVNSGAQVIRSQVVISGTAEVWTVVSQSDGSVSFTLPSLSLALTGWNVANIPTSPTAPITLEQINATDLRQLYFFEVPNAR